MSCIVLVGLALGISAKPAQAVPDRGRCCFLLSSLICSTNNSCWEGIFPMVIFKGIQNIFNYDLLLDFCVNNLYYGKKSIQIRKTVCYFQPEFYKHLYACLDLTT